jgi:hypothetical protein
MSDVALKNAVTQRDRLASEINQLNQRLHDLRIEITSVDEWIAGWHRFAGTHSSNSQISPEIFEHSKNTEAQSAGDSVDSAPNDRTRTTGNPKKELVAATVRRIIEETGQPVSRSDLYKELAARGIHIGGKDPEQVLSTMLWRTRGAIPVTRLKSGGYWLTEVPHIDSGYEPSTNLPATIEKRVQDIVASNVIMQLLMDSEGPELVEFDEHMSRSDKAPDKVIDYMENNFPTLFDKDMLESDFFAREFQMALGSRMKSLGLYDEDSPA